MTRLRSLLGFIFLAGCGAGSQAGAASSSASPATQPAEPGADATSTADRMWHDFLDGTEARDAVIAGKLEAVRAPLRRLSQRPHGDPMPIDWRPWIEEMQAEAARGAAAKTLEEAAASVAALGGSCGECHRTTHGGPDWSGDPQGYDDYEEGGLPEKMRRHKWSAEELWLGLTGPVHQAWSRGAAGLMNINVPSLVDHRGAPVPQERAPSGEGSLQGEPHPELPDQDAAARPATAGTIDLDAALRELRELGKRADQAEIPRDKQLVYGAIISRCGHCHASLGIRVP